jgi:hypothetical protein
VDACEPAFSNLAGNNGVEPGAVKEKIVARYTISLQGPAVNHGDAARPAFFCGQHALARIPGVATFLTSFANTKLVPRIWPPRPSKGPECRRNRFFKDLSKVLDDIVSSIYGLIAVEIRNFTRSYL